MVLNNPKTESSVRKIFLPTTVANQLVEWKKKQDETKEVLGDAYEDYNLVMTTLLGMPVSDGSIRKSFKLKLNGGDIKAVQGDSGHAQINMVTDVYSHIIDDDRRKKATMFENAF